MSKSTPIPAPIALIIVFISSFFNISINLAFSVFITLPLRGKIAWNFLSLPDLAEPPAESPSTKNNSFSFTFLVCAGVSFPLKICLSLRALLVFLASNLAFLADSRESDALLILSNIFLAICLFSVIQVFKFLLTASSTALLASGVPNLSLVWLTNSKNFSGILTDNTTVKPSLTSSPSNVFLPFNTFSSKAKSLNVLVMADLSPISWVPPSLVFTLFTNESIVSLKPSVYWKPHSISISLTTVLNE